MTATVTSLPSYGKFSIPFESTPAALPTFEQALKKVEEANASLGLARLHAHRRVSEALRQAEAQEEAAVFALTEALVLFHCAGGKAEDLGSIHDALPGALEDAVEAASTPLEEIFE